jgi:hypothetical protein
MLMYSTIDHALGSHSGRYFGDGHRGSSYEFEAAEVSGRRATGYGSVSHDGTWSTKALGQVSRHLTSVDAVALATLALDEVLAHQPVPVESLFVTELSLRAGAAAVQDLSSTPVDVSATWLVGRRAFRCEARVGTITLELVARPVVSCGGGQDPRLGRHFYSEHLQDRTQHLADIALPGQAPEARMTAALGALHAAETGDGSYSGLQSGHHELFSVSDAVVCLAQLGQALAYAYDGVPRDATSNFWLRRLSVRLVRPYLRIGQLTHVDLGIVRAGTVSLAGERWRTLRLDARATQLTAVADVAHVLPQGAGA